MESTESSSSLSKLFRFEWKKDIWWILFIIALLFTAYGYKRDISQCKEAALHPCVYCYYGVNATKLLAENPTASLQCNWVGVSQNMLPVHYYNITGG